MLILLLLCLSEEIENLIDSTGDLFGGWIMKQLIVILLLTIIILIGDGLFTQETGSLISAAEISTEDVNLAFTGKWAWHKVHKRTVKKQIKKNTLKKTDICLNCHIENENNIFNPHAQLNKNRDIIKEKCLYCHLEKPDEKYAIYENYRPEIKFVGRLGMLCTGCHRKRLDFAHPANANHILRPSYKMQAMMKTSEMEFDIILPLDLEGKIMCATCHNPHEKGIIPKEKSAAKGASDKYRVRLTDQSERDASKMAVDKHWVLMPGKVKTVTVKETSTNSMVRMTGSTKKICTTCHRDIMTF